MQFISNASFGQDRVARLMHWLLNLPQPVSAFFKNPGRTLNEFSQSTLLDNIWPEWRKLHRSEELGTAGQLQMGELWNRRMDVVSQEKGGNEKDQEACALGNAVHGDTLSWRNRVIGIEKA